MNRTAATFGLSGLGLLAVAAGGCATEPVTTESEPKAQITISDLRDSASQMGQSLAADLENLVRYDFGGERVAMFLGDIDNRTGSVSTNDFDIVQRQIRNEMFRNRYFRDNVELREASARMDAASARERDGGGGDPFGDNPGFQGLNVDPEFVFFLNGDARKLDRRDETGFFVEMTLTRESNGAIVWTQDYLVTYGDE